MIVDKVFIIEVITINRLSPGAVTVREIASLCHKVWYYPVDQTSLER